MRQGDVRTPSDAVAYLADCALDAVQDMARKKRRVGYDYDRKIEVAQAAITWMQRMHIPLSGRAYDVIEECNGKVAKWAAKYEA